MHPRGGRRLRPVAAARIASLSLHQRTASIDARERLAVLAAAAVPRDDAIALLTCHRVELYAAIPAEAEPREWFGGLFRDDAIAEATLRIDAEAADHLFRVAAGLDSAIVGEAQVANQLRRAFDDARRTRLDPALAGLIQRALRLARAVRAGTPLGAVRRSIGSLAVDEALARTTDPAGATVLVVGAGEIGKLAARALARRVRRLVVANRDRARAQSVAEPIAAEAIGLDELDRVLVDVDAVISAADTRGSLLTRDLLARRAALRPLVVVDIAMPRSVADHARDLPGLVYRDVDDLAADGSTVPVEVVEAVERRCADEAAAFMRWLHERDRVPTVRALHEHAARIRERQLARALRHLGHLPPRDREVVASLAGALTNALLHEPTVRLRRTPEHERAARALFGLDA
jgi:glutamyl-tRNA reductase